MTLTCRCPACGTLSDRPQHDPEMTVLSCACGAYQRIYFEDPAKKIRDALERAEGRSPGNTLLASFRSQFESRGTLTPKQLETLGRMAGNQ